MEKLKAVIYIRVSDRSQLENNSFETQLKSCRSFAEANNYEVIRVFQEDAKSAKHTHNRPEMKEMFSFCTNKDNKISAVIVYKMDRWTRNTEEGLVAISLLSRYGVAVMPATEMSEQNSMGKAMRTILMALAELDNDLKGERVRDNMKTMFKNGLWCWKSRIGYKRPHKTKEENKGKPTIIDPRFREILKELFIKAAEMKSSKKYLATYLNNLGFKEVYGKEADSRLVSRIISDTFYYGYMYAPTWKEYSWGKHEALVSQEIWENANRNVFGRMKKYRHQDNGIFPLKGLLYGSTCSHPMTSSNPKGTSKNYLYYECHGSKCKNKERISVESAHAQLLNILSTLRPSERVLKIFNHLVFSEWDKSIEEKRREAELLDVQIKALEKKTTAIAESNTKGILTDDEAKLGVEEVRRDITVLRMERGDIRIEQYDEEAVRNFMEDFLLHLDKLWVQLDLQHKQALQSEIFPQGFIVEGGKIRINALAHTFKLIEALEDQNVELVTQMFLHWNRIRFSLEQWKSIVQPEACPPSSLATRGY